MAKQIIYAHLCMYLSSHPSIYFPVSLSRAKLGLYRSIIELSPTLLPPRFQGQPQEAAGMAKQIIYAHLCMYLSSHPSIYFPVSLSRAKLGLQRSVTELSPTLLPPRVCQLIRDRNMLELHRWCYVRGSSVTAAAEDNGTCGLTRLTRGGSGVL